jgi:DTW domain-containing protein YfiP
MHDKEVFKPSNTGWLIADVIDDTTRLSGRAPRSTGPAGAAR